jgi:hypothetical protein
MTGTTRIDANVVLGVRCSVAAASYLKRFVAGSASRVCETQDRLLRRRSTPSSTTLAQITDQLHSSLLRLLQAGSGFLRLDSLAATNSGSVKLFSDAGPKEFDDGDGSDQADGPA